MNPRPVYWSIRRELWENRSIYIAPLIVAGVALFGFMISTFRLARRMRTIASMHPEQQRQAMAAPFSITASLILFSGIIVAVFYCLDALQSERRDRSILFWKSLPVSDRTTVLSKASIPMLLQPLLCFGIALVVQLIMLFVTTMVVAASGMSPGMLWSRLPLVQMPLVMLYGVIIHALWYAPIYGWLLLVSAWAKRATILWAALPFVALLVVEQIAFGTRQIASMLRYRAMGAMAEGFDVDAMQGPITRFSQLTPLQFLSSPGLWFGLLFAAACLVAAIRLRRNREPI